MKSTLDRFLQAYIECALWSSLGDDENPLDATYDPKDIAPDSIQKMKDDCEKFLTDNIGLILKTPLTYTTEQAGHDFWLTRNGHGAGFWDRGLGDIGGKLTKACHEFKEINLIVGDDGKLYVE